FEFINDHIIYFFESRTVLSSLLLVSSVPSGVHANSPRPTACPSSTDLASPVDASHSRAVSSPAPLAINSPRMESRRDDDGAPDRLTRDDEARHPGPIPSGDQAVRPLR